MQKGEHLMHVGLCKNGIEHQGAVLEVDWYLRVEQPEKYFGKGYFGSERKDLESKEIKSCWS